MKRKALIAGTVTAATDIAFGVMFLIGWLRWLARNDDLHDYLESDDSI